MTIQDALERAKQLRKSRERSPGTRGDRPTVALDETGTFSVVREPVQLASASAPELEAVHYPDLDRVELDPIACDEHKILISDTQLSQWGRAGAAYRMLRSRILHRVRGSNWSCIGVTSPGPGEGKTVTTTNLAISIAREKQRPVVLLDLDMRSPSVLEYLGVQPPRPLTAIFDTDARFEQVLFATNVENLIIAGAREGTQAASEWLASPRLDEFMAYVRRRWPGVLIVIDLPPALSTDEALVVAPRTDALFLVVSEGKTRRDGLSRTVDLLSDCTVAGIILNRSSEEMGDDYYGY